MSLPFLLYKISHSDWPLFSNILIAKISLLIISTNLLSPGLHKEKKNFLGIIPTSLAATIDFFFLWWRMKQKVGFGFFFPWRKIQSALSVNRLFFFDPKSGNQLTQILGAKHTSKESKGVWSAGTVLPAAADKVTLPALLSTLHVWMPDLFVNQLLNCCS